MLALKIYHSTAGVWKWQSSGQKIFFVFTFYRKLEHSRCTCLGRHGRKQKEDCYICYKRKMCMLGGAVEVCQLETHYNQRRKTSCIFLLTSRKAWSKRIVLPLRNRPPTTVINRPLCRAVVSAQIWSGSQELGDNLAAMNGLKTYQRASEKLSWSREDNLQTKFAQFCEYFDQTMLSSNFLSLLFQSSSLPQPLKFSHSNQRELQDRSS